MVQFSEIKVDWEALKKAGLPKSETNTAIAEAARYLVAVIANMKDQYLSREVLDTREDVRRQVADLGANYPQLRWQIARALGEALPANMDTVMVLQLTEEAVIVGAALEWRYLGNYQWQRTDSDGHVNIHRSVLDLGAHLFDFRKVHGGQMRGPRHFLPTDWHNRAQAELCQKLAEAAKKAKEAWDAAHGRKPAMKQALEDAGVVKPVAALLEEPAAIPVPPAPTLPAVRFKEDIPEAKENRRRVPKKRTRRERNLEENEG